MANVYEDTYLTQGVTALSALGNRIGLFTSAGVRVGTVYADTTWGTATVTGTAPARKGVRTGSKVTINVPASTVATGTVISHYGIFNGTTLLRKVDLKPLTATVSDGSQAFDIDVTPTMEFDPTE